MVFFGYVSSLGVTAIENVLSHRWELPRLRYLWKIMLIMKYEDVVR